MSSARRVRTDPRISRRRKAVTRSRRRRLAVRLALLAVLAAAIWGIFWSPLLDIRDVKVQGNSFTPVEDVVAAAGVGEEDNLLLVSTGAITERVERLPWVLDADVDRILPSTVRVKVTERKPYMVLSLGAARWTIDVSGRVLASGEAVKGLPVIAGAKVAELEPGQRIGTPETSAALVVHKSLPKKLRARVVAVFAPSVDRITLSLDDGLLVRYGAAESIEEKNEVLSSLLARLAAEGRTVEYVDVRVPTSPAIGPDVKPGADDLQSDAQ